MRAPTHVAALAAAGALALTAGLSAQLAAPEGTPLAPPQAQAAEAKVAVTPSKATEGIFSVKVAQNKVDSKRATVTVNKLGALKSVGISRVKLTATMSFNGKVAVSKTRTIKLDGAEGSRTTAGITLPEFGSYQVKAQFYVSGVSAPARTLHLPDVGIAAREYNIAVLNGTYAPLVFTMMMYDDNDITRGGSVPTYVALSRDAAYDWDKLPACVGTSPLAKSPTAGNYAYKRKAMAAYVKSLRKANKNSRFNVYVTDNGMTALMDVMYASGVGDNRMSVKLLSDGTASAVYFNEMYNNPSTSPTPVNAKIAAEYRQLQDRFASGKQPDIQKKRYALKTGNVSTAMPRYTYAAMCTHDNYSWYMGYMGSFASTSAEFLAEAKASMTSYGLAGQLEKIKGLGNSEAFKAAFHLSDQLFADAHKAGKQIMMLMGTRVNLETNFEPFAKFVKQYYGTDYAYYYKGHPATNTKNYPEKQAELKRLGITDVDSSIAAELILFYNPDVFVSGLSNSTLNSSYQEGHTGVFLNTRLSGKDSIINGDLFGLFFTKIDASYEPELLALVEGDAALEHSYLVEANDGTGDVAIYDDAAGSITWYKKDASGYVKASA